MNAIVMTNQANQVATIEGGLTVDMTAMPITDKVTAELLADSLLQGADSPKTKTTYKQAITSFVLFMGQLGLGISQVAKVHVKQFKEQLASEGNTWGAHDHKIKPLSAISINKYLAAVKFALTELADNGKVKENVLSACKRVKSKKDKGKPLAGQYIPLSERQAVTGRIDELTAGDSYKAMLKAIFALLQLGLRREEIANLNVDSLKSERLTVHGKGNKTRVILLASAKFTALRADIMAWADRLCGADCEAGKPLFFQVSTSKAIQWGHRISGQSIYQIIKKLMPSYSPHDFRRTMVSDLLTAGVDIATIQKISGHESADMVARYDRRGEGAIQSAMERLIIC